MIFIVFSLQQLSFFIFFSIFFIFFINCLYFFIIYILLVISFYIIFYFLEVFCNHYFIRIKKLRSYIFFINQIETYILFFFLLILSEDNLKSLNLINIQLMYCSKLIDCAQQY